MSTAPIVPVEPTVAALATQLRIVSGKLARRLREHGHFGELTWTQVKVLGRLDREGPATVSALAHAEGIRPQSMGATVAALKSAGLISGAPDPHDGRQTLLSLTPACHEWIQVSRAAREDWLMRAIASRLDPAEQVALATAIGLLERLLEP
ncbi:MAG: MarR family transcriptional regulator [Pseudomonadota bacterium]|jgi:DNA-binding MarR family transcriptional regulator|nr:MarR family transcriptional regulator [Pseudomonadota bacterium]